MQYVNRTVPLTEEEKQQQEAEREQREADMRMRNNRLGLTIFQGSWIMVFVCLLVVYWQLGYQPGWRPSADQAPNPLLPTLATVGLLASAWFARRGLKTVAHSAQGQSRQFLAPWQVAIGLGAAFFVVMMSQFFAVPVGDNGQQFGYVYRLMIGYHAIHAVVIGFMMIQVWRYGRAGVYHAENFWSVEATAKLWYFVVVAWLLFYAVLYLPFLG